MLYFQGPRDPELESTYVYVCVGVSIEGQEDFLEYITIFISWGCYNQLPQILWLKTTEICYLQLWSLEVWNEDDSRVGSCQAL